MPHALAGGSSSRDARDHSMPQNSTPSSSPGSRQPGPCAAKKYVAGAAAVALTALGAAAAAAMVLLASEDARRTFKLRRSRRIRLRSDHDAFQTHVQRYAKLARRSATVTIKVIGSSGDNTGG